MQRKLIKQGEGGITISLPIDWVRRQKLTPGNYIHLTEQEGALVITGSAPTAKENVILLHEQNEKLLRTVLSAAYRKGCDEVKVPGIKLKNSEYVVRGDTVILGTGEQNSSRCLQQLFQCAYLAHELLLQGNTAERENIREKALVLRDEYLRSIAAKPTAHAFELYSFVLFFEKAIADWSRVPVTAADPHLLRRAYDILKEMQSCINLHDFKKANALYVKTHALTHVPTTSATAERIAHYLLGMASRLQTITSEDT